MLSQTVLLLWYGLQEKEEWVLLEDASMAMDHSGILSVYHSTPSLALTLPMLLRAAGGV